MTSGKNGPSDQAQLVSSMDANKMPVTDWLEIQDPDYQERWQVHVPFLMSNWNCIFGKGCPGIAEMGRNYEPSTPAGADVGCCSHGAYINSKEDRDSVAKYAEMLTEEDLHKPALDHIRKNGYFNTYSESDDDYNGKTKVRNGACVFVNRSHEAAPGDEERTGCAFLYLAARLNEESVEEVDHTETMPDVCWQVPFRIWYDTDRFGDVNIIYPWDASQWNDNGDADFYEWWCVNSSDAYTAKQPLYIDAKNELTKIMGAKAYEIMAKELDKRRGDEVAPMPAVGPEGRKMLPLAVT